MACWLDESVETTATRIRFQHSAQFLFSAPDPNQTVCNSVSQPSNLITDMCTGNLFSVIRAGPSLFWWGIMPANIRLKSIDKYLTKYVLSPSSKSSKSSLNNSSDIRVGSLVSLRSQPLYAAGTLAIFHSGNPKLGELCEHVFTMPRLTLSSSTDAASATSTSASNPVKTHYRFKLLRKGTDLTIPSATAMPPPSTGEQQQHQPIVGSLKRKRSNYYGSAHNLMNLNNENDSSFIHHEHEEEEELWSLNDVVFVNEEGRAALGGAVLGRVIKIDGDYVLVNMQTPSVSNAAQDSASQSLDTALEHTRIFQKNQLQLVRASSSSGGTSSRSMPDFMQRTPKKLADMGGVVYAYAAHQNGVHAIVNKESSGGLFYMHYDLLTNKLAKEKRLPTTPAAFLGLGGTMNVSLTTIDHSSVSKFKKII